MSVIEKDLLDINVDDIRSEIPSLKNIVFFNSGWTGPTPKVVIDSIQESLQNQIVLGPSSRDAVIAQVNELSCAKSQVASFFSCKPENICLTTGTTLGINIALNGYNWNSNDEIITTKSDHASVVIPLYNLKERYDVKIKLIDIDINDPIKSFKENISKNTKAVVFCHIYWTNGNALPVKEIVNELRARNVISIIDGAQSAGALLINLDNLAPDFYCVPGQKWLLGPIGTGFLYVNNKHFSKRPPWPSVLGYESAGDASNDELYDLDYKWYPKKDAGVFEFGGMSNSLFCGLGSAINFGKKSLDKFDIYKRIYYLAQYLSDALKENTNLSVLTSNEHAGIISWQHKKLKSREIVSRLWKEKRILIREIGMFNICRASVHYFNTKDEIDLLVDALGGV